MKGKITAILTGIVLVAGLLFAGSVAASGPGRNGDMWQSNVTLKESDTVDGSYYAAGQTITVAGTVKGDVYCAGKNIVVSGDVEGDVICAGQTVKVSGSVGGDVRLAGQAVTLDGAVGKNATAFGSAVDITKSARIGQDLNGAGESVTIDGNVGRDVAFGGNTIIVVGTLGRNADIDGENITVADGASITGTLHYTSKNEASIAPGAVKGKVEYTKATDEQREDRSADWSISSALYMMLAFLVIALALVLVAPQLVNGVAATGQKRMGMSILSGVVFLVAAPMLVVLVAITIIGVPLAIVLTLIWLTVLLLSGPFAAYYLGRLLLRTRTSNIIARMAVGAVVLVILYAIPIVNILVAVTTLILGSGMFSLHAISSQKKFSYTIK